MKYNLIILLLIMTTFCNGFLNQENLILNKYRKREFLNKAAAICTSNRNFTEPLKFFEAKENRKECAFCSDDADCGKSHACCFEEDDTFKLKTKTEYECISNRFPAEGFLAYNMVVDDGHCKNIPGHVPCKERSVSVLGSLHPVTSTKTGNVYKNEICAQCNNDADNLIAWGMFFTCKTEEKNNFFTLLDTINNYGNEIFKNFDCAVTLRSPKLADTDLKHSQQCFRHLTSDCSGPMLPPYDTGLTQAYITHSCEGDFFNPCIYNRVSYKNIYCALCNFVSTPYAQSFCQPIFSISQTTPNDFTVLLQPRNLDDMVKTSVDLKIGAQLKNSTSSVSCRHLHCPTGKQRLGNGECAMVYQHTNINVLTAFFTFTVDSALSSEFSQVASLDTLNSMFGEVVFIGIDNAKSTSVFLGKMYRMELYGDTIDETIQKVEKNIELGVDINLNGTSVHANITLVGKPIPWYVNESLVVDFDYEALLNASQGYTTYKPLYVHALFFQQKQMKRLTTLEYGSFYSSEQVDLNQDEFILHKGIDKGVILYNRYTQTYLFSNAFYLIQNKDGTDAKARVALADSGFEKVACNTARKGPCHLGHVLSFLLHLTVTGIRYHWY